MRRSATRLSVTGSPARATRTTSSTVRDSPSIVSKRSPPAGDGGRAIKVLRARAMERFAEKVHTGTPDSEVVQIVFLGTSGSWPTPKRNVSAVAVKRGPEVLLFDCGEGTQRQFMMSKLSFMQTTRIFLTHFHGDHFLGLPGLVQSMSMNGREKELLVYGPTGTEDLVRTLVNLGHFAPAFSVVAKGLKGGVGVDGGEYTVRAIDTSHTVPSVGYALEEKANRYGHSTGRQAAEIARDAGVRALILTHVSPRYEDTSTILAEAKATFPNTYMAEDFFEYEVPYPD